MINLLLGRYLLTPVATVVSLLLPFRNTITEEIKLFHPPKVCRCLQWEHCTIFSSSLNLCHRQGKTVTHPPTSDTDSVYLKDFFFFFFFSLEKKKRYFFPQHWPLPPANPRANWLTRSGVESRLFAPQKRSPKTLPALPLFDRPVIVWMHSIHRWESLAFVPTPGDCTVKRELQPGHLMSSPNGLCSKVDWWLNPSLPESLSLPAPSPQWQYD